MTCFTGKPRLIRVGCCLRSSSRGDAGWEIRQWFSRELEAVRDSGRCSADFLDFLCLFRAGLCLDTQEVEGMNSVIQRMCKVAAVHSDFLDVLGSESYINRFLPVVPAHAPPEEPTSLCVHQESFVAASGLAMGLRLGP